MHKADGRRRLMSARGRVMSPPLSSTECACALCMCSWCASKAKAPLCPGDTGSRADSSWTSPSRLLFPPMWSGNTDMACLKGRSSSQDMTCLKGRSSSHYEEATLTWLVSSRSPLCCVVFFFHRSPMCAQSLYLSITRTHTLYLL
jgi:hypothetical protein